MAGHYHCPSTHLGLGQPHMYSNVQCTHSLRSVHAQFIRDWVLLRGPVHHQGEVTMCDQYISQGHAHMHTVPCTHTCTCTCSTCFKYTLCTDTVKYTECPRLTCGQTHVLEDLSAASSSRESPHKVAPPEWRAALCSTHGQQTTPKYTHAYTPHTTMYYSGTYSLGAVCGST